MSNHIFIAASAVVFSACAALPLLAKEETRIQATEILKSEQTVLEQPIRYPEGQARITSVLLTLEPGQETGMHIHRVPVFGYMVEGELTVDYGEKGVRVYNAGDAVMEAVDWPHNGVNKTNAPVKILAVFMGAEGVSNTEPVPPQ